MLSFALNHITVPNLTLRQARDLACELGMVGLELRNDMEHPLFDGQGPQGLELNELHVLALAEVKAFNAFDEAIFDTAVALMDLAVACGAEAIALIPQVGGGDVAPDGLDRAIRDLGPELAARGILGLIEPVGFENSTIRHKADVVAAIDRSNHAAQFGLIHDAFHHDLAGGGAVYPEHTKVVHISGVPASATGRLILKDADRGMVGADDRLGNIDQITELMRGGFSGPLSFEVFSPDVHALIDPKAALSRSIHFIESHVMAHAA